MSTEKLLNELLASTFVMYLKTHNAHWDVVGENFYEIHILLEKQYKKLWKSIDIIAERIRYFKHYPQLDLQSIYDNSIISVDAWGKSLSSNTLIKNLLSDREKLSSLSKNLIQYFITEKDDVTANMIVNIAEEHDKSIWMLRSFIKNES